MRKLRLLMAAIAASTVSVVAAQSANPTPSPSNPVTPSPPAPGSTGTDRGMGTGASAKPGSLTNLAKADGVFVREAAAANKAEVALGTLAATNGAAPAVKEFGQKMVADHAQAYDELAQIASAKGVTVPSEPTGVQKRTAAKLAKLSGAAFDREFVAVMVEDHKKAVALFRDEAANGRDADLRALAAKALPTLEAHLQTAQQLLAQVTAKN